MLIRFVVVREGCIEWSHFVDFSDAVVRPSEIVLLFGMICLDTRCANGIRRNPSVGICDTACMVSLMSVVCFLLQLESALFVVWFAEVFELVCGTSVSCSAFRSVGPFQSRRWCRSVWMLPSGVSS